MITYGTDIAYGIYAMWFYFGIVVTLVVEGIILSIVAAVMKRKTKGLKKQYEEAKNGK